MVVKVQQREIKRYLMGKTRVRKALPTAGLFFLVCRCQAQKVREVFLLIKCQIRCLAFVHFSIYNQKKRIIGWLYTKE